MQAVNVKLKKKKKRRKRHPWTRSFNASKTHSFAHLSITAIAKRKVSITCFHFISQRTSPPQRGVQLCKQKRTEKAPDLHAIRHRSTHFFVYQGHYRFIHDAGADHPEQPCDEHPDGLGTYRRHRVLGPRWVEEEQRICACGERCPCGCESVRVERRRWARAEKGFVILTGAAGLPFACRCLDSCGWSCIEGLAS